MYQLIVQPTWKTAVVRKRLKGGLGDFQIDLMDGVFKKKKKKRIVMIKWLFGYQCRYVLSVANIFS